MKRYKSQLFEKFNDAYWISLKGKIIKVETTHIDVVIDHPDYFGYSFKDIESIYNKHNEELGSEGKAREEILRSLFKHHWIRIRKYIKPDKWSVNVYELNHKQKDYLQDWASIILKQKGSKFDDVVIDLNYGQKIYTLDQLSKDILYLEEGLVVKHKRFTLQFKKFSE